MANIVSVVGDRRQAQRLLDAVRRELAGLCWAIHFGDASGTVGPLSREIDEAVQSARHRRALRLRLLRAMALDRVGQASQADAERPGVLEIAAREGFMRLILDEGPAVGPLVHRHAALAEAGGACDPLRIDHLQRLLRALGPAAPDTERDPAQAPTSADAMAERLPRRDHRLRHDGGA